LILIAQDTSSYGRDLGMKDGLPVLLKEISMYASKIPWIRCLYTFPGAISDDLIKTMAHHKQFVHYLDLPLQHAHLDVLRRMQRPAKVDWVRRMLEKMRTAMPDLALRTTFIVGFPGETDVEFQTLLDFVEEIQFDHVGIFPYYHEADTPAQRLGDSVPSKVKKERTQSLAALQERISLEKNQSMVGTILDVLIEGVDQNISVGRSYRDAPEIDGLVIVEGRAEVGKMVKVQITGAMVHDLTGTLLKEKN